MLHDDEVLCIDHMQSFRDRVNFNNLNVYATKTICMQIRKLNRMQNYKRNHLWKSFNSVSHHCDDEN